jgi:DNA helicase-2/ATP-dependent DNA helicase PcrA
MMNLGRLQQPDTPADISLRDCLNGADKRSFIVVAGAGSGKTTSLVKALDTIVKQHGSNLKRNRQRVSCITYTEIAATEIWADVGTNSLVHVSTIHSFFWMLVRNFQMDIRPWVDRRISEKLDDLNNQAVNFGPRVQARTREKNRRDIERYNRERERIGSVKVFTYGTGSNYPKGLLGHDDVMKLTTDLLTEQPLFRTLLAQQFPFVFVDESQDTSPDAVNALKAVENQMRGKFCLGFFGDPMQQIYATGIGNVAAEDGWVTIQKPENFRCAASVLAVANAVRRDGDHLVQTRGRTEEIDGVTRTVEGTARIFVLPTNGDRDENIARVRDWVADQNRDPAWRNNESNSVKVLVIVHRMAATRLGFGDIYAALNDNAPEAFKNGFLDASTWPLRPFISFCLPLSDAIQNSREFEVMTILRQHCDLLKKEELPKKNVPELLRRLWDASRLLATMMQAEERRTIREVLVYLRDSELVTLDPRMLAYLAQQLPPADKDVEPDEQEAGKEVRAMESFLACPAAQLWGYLRYIKDESPFSTQQGIKGAEFPRVLVVLDDEEGTHTQFSYDKYLRIKPLSDRDMKNVQEGKETVVERTRRLFYVCCTRAVTDLVVVVFSSDPSLAEQRIREANIFPVASTFNFDALS